MHLAHLLSGTPKDVFLACYHSMRNRCAVGVCPRAISAGISMDNLHLVGFTRLIKGSKDWNEEFWFWTDEHLPLSMCQTYELLTIYRVILLCISPIGLLSCRYLEQCVSEPVWSNRYCVLRIYTTLCLVAGQQMLRFAPRLPTYWCGHWRNLTTAGHVH